MTSTSIVCGIQTDGGGLGAARRAARLMPEGTPIVLVASADLEATALSAQPLGGQLDLAPMAPIPPSPALEPLEDVMREELEEARRALAGLGPIETQVSVGPLSIAMQEAADAREHALLAIDAPREHRIVGILDGNPATWLMHESGHPLLLSRGPDDATGFPHTVVVGLDGSPSSAAAALAAGEIAARCGAELRVVVAGGGRGVDAGGVAASRAELPEHTLVEDRRGAVHALAESDGDLIVVGSRGLHGLRALGSVSERVAHGAVASVLVVR